MTKQSMCSYQTPNRDLWMYSGSMDVLPFANLPFTIIIKHHHLIVDPTTGIYSHVIKLQIITRKITEKRINRFQHVTKCC